MTDEFNIIRVSEEVCYSILIEARPFEDVKDLFSNLRLKDERDDVSYYIIWDGE